MAPPDAQCKTGMARNKVRADMLYIIYKYEPIIFSNLPFTKICQKCRHKIKKDNTRHQLCGSAKKVDACSMGSPTMRSRMPRV